MWKIYGIEEIYFKDLPKKCAWEKYIGSSIEVWDAASSRKHR